MVPEPVRPSVDAEMLGAGDPLARAASGVGQLRVQTRKLQASSCTAFIVGDGLILTTARCVRKAQEASFVLVKGSAMFELPVVLPALEVDADLDYALLEIPKGATTAFPPLVLQSEPPPVGKPLATVCFDSDMQKLGVATKECKVSAVGPSHLEHQCVLGWGASGAPLMSRDGWRVVAINSTRSHKGGGAIRADVILKRSARLSGTSTATSP
jgi:hypothetical protein